MKVRFVPPSLGELALRLVIRKVHRVLLDGERDWGTTHLESGPSSLSGETQDECFRRFEREVIGILRANGLRVQVAADEVRISVPAEFTGAYMDAVPPDQAPPCGDLVIMSASRARREDGLDVFLCRTLPAKTSRRVKHPEVSALRYVVPPANYGRIPKDWCLKDDVARRLNAARRRPNHFESEDAAESHARDVCKASEYHALWRYGAIPFEDLDEEKVARKRALEVVEDFSDLSL